jgi:hypothetical protein
MAINVSQAFKRTSKNPIDETFALTKAQMLTVNDNLMPDYYFTVCQDDGCFYLYDKSATASQTTGKFAKFEGGTDSLAFGYLNATNGKFYKESTYTTEIAGNTGKLYITLDTNYIYRYDVTNGFIQVGGSSVGGTVEGYLNPTNGKFYEESTYTTEITGEAGKLYVTLDTDKTYRYDSTNGFVEVGGGSASSSFVKGYYYNGGFYEEQAHTTPITGEQDKIYLDIPNEKCYEYDGTNFNRIDDEEIKRSVLPTADASNLGAIYLYTGSTTGSYTHGYFYECVSDGAVSPTYSWSAITQDAKNNVVDAYYNPTDGLFYEEQAYTTAITGEADVIYQDIPTSNQYRWDGSAFVQTNTRSRELTQAQYDALTTAEKNNGTTYFITDGDSQAGHTILDDGVAMTDRPALNFTDFDMSDNSTDEETDVKPHRLTSAELDEIVLPVAHEYEGEVIDLRGNEIKVGTVIASDGTKKTLWQKTVDCGELPNATRKTVTHDVQNIGDVISVDAVAKNNTSGVYMPLPRMAINDPIDFFVKTDAIVITTITDYSSYTKTFVTIRYTKTAS